MTRHHTLHSPAAGIRLVWPVAITVVLDPGSDERARTGHLNRERYLVALAVLLSAVGVVVLVRSEPFDSSWLVAAVLLLSALACHAIRPRRRTVPAGLVDLLEPLRGVVPTEPAEIHRLVWEAADLTAAAGDTDRPSCPICARRVAQIVARLRALTSPVPSDRSWTVFGHSVRQAFDSAVSSIPDARRHTSLTRAVRLRRRSDREG
ncbi:hypothetical protein ACFT2C_04535 [Promicromonospora sp. NPDC057138]|uniref:hypothetical protein n=1 Tax=Promicromonospora sp. NPDC057138 TaxID=3346031 RepID=UPI00363C64D3